MSIQATVSPFFMDNFLFHSIKIQSCSKRSNVECILIIKTGLMCVYISSLNSINIRLIFILEYIYLQARFACLRCAAGGHFVSAGGSLRSPGVTLVNYKGDNISKYVCPTDLINMARKITKFINF